MSAGACERGRAWCTVYRTRPGRTSERRHPDMPPHDSEAMFTDGDAAVSPSFNLAHVCETLHNGAPRSRPSLRKMTPMDAGRFNHLVRTTLTKPSRRAVIRGLAALVAGLALTLLFVA